MQRESMRFSSVSVGVFAVPTLTSPFLEKGVQSGISLGAQIPPRPPLLKGGNPAGLRRCCITYVVPYKLAEKLSYKPSLRGNRFLFLFLQFRFNGLLKPLKASLIEQLPVYENGGRSLDICLTAVVHVPVNQRRNGRVFEILVELFHVQAELLGDRLHFGIAQIFWLANSFSWHLPELPLFCRPRGRRWLPSLHNRASEGETV